MVDAVQPPRAEDAFVGPRPGRLVIRNWAALRGARVRVRLALHSEVLEHRGESIGLESR